MGHCLSSNMFFTREGTLSGGLLDWDGTPLKRYQRCPMVSSNGSEIRFRELKSNASFTVFRIARNAGTKVGLSEQQCSIGRSLF